MLPNKKKPRLPRIDREEVVVVHEDENSHLWAVSYSDFLMALMSFFILFYSADSSNRKTIIMNLAKTFSKDGKPYSAGYGEGEKDQPHRIPASFTDALKNMNVDVAQDQESLVVNFPDDFFRPGRHEISTDSQSEIEKFLVRLKPFQAQINLYFEGHADNNPMKVHKSNIIVDNFVLSSLRASSALIIAKNMGFSEKNLYIQADSSNVRNSRSLSIRIEPRKEIL